ncbi:MAG: ABC transporter ATP-binding protein [Candidatus Bathyarchaeia archaeon]
MLLELINVSSGYGKTRILEGVDLQVDEGEIVAILGPNGSGKTTLLNTVFGLATLFEGEIRFQDKPIVGLKPNEVASIGIGYAPQQQNVFSNFTVEENCILGAFLRKDGEVRKDVEEIFKLFPEIERRRNNLAKTLSGGERQMLAVARAMMLRPRLLMLDEPTAGLSPKAASTLVEKIREIRSRGTTIMLVEQNARIALGISDRAYIIVGGKVVTKDSSSNFLIRKDLEQIYFK